MKNTDWSDVAWAFCLTAIIILTVGTPDLLDAVIHYVNNAASCKP